MTEEFDDEVVTDVEIFDGEPTFDRSQAIEDGRQDDGSDPEDQESYDEEEDDQ